MFKKILTLLFASLFMLGVCSQAFAGRVVINEVMDATLQISYDNSTYQSASFYDYAGGSTLQTSETLSADGNYYFWFNKDLVAPYTRVIATATGSDADDTADVIITFVGKE